MSARVWSGAAIASVLLHGAGLGAIALSTEPDPAPDQDVPKSAFSIAAAEVPRSRAAPQTPPSDQAPETQASASAAQSGAIPQSRARATPLDGDKVSQSPTSTAPLKPSTSTEVPIKPAPPATATLAITPASDQTRVAALATATPALSAATAPAQSLKASAQSTLTVSAAPAPAATLSAALPVEPARVQAIAAPAAQPATPAETILSAALRSDLAPAAPLPATSQTALPSDPDAARATPALTTGTPAPASAPDAPHSSALTLPSERGTATLAWSGADNTAVSATSLAAIAAFTEAGDLSAASADVRDGIAGILASVPCARLQTTFLPDTGQLEVRGHIPDNGLRGPILTALQEQIGEAIALSDQLLILPRPQCGALSGIAGVGLPQSTEQLNDPAVIGEDGFARTYTYRDGERLRLDLTAPDYDAYIYMDYFVADGSVIHLQPNEIVPLEFAPAKSAQSVGRARADKPFLELTIAPPFGQEIAAAFASSVPLYEGTRPIQEPAGPYLEFLKQQVAQARETHPDFKGEWVYFFISTRPAE